MRRSLPAALLFQLLTAATTTPEPSQDTVLTRVEPCRLVDTREALRPGVARSFLVAGQCGVPADASAVALDVVASAEGRGYLVAYPSDAVGPAAWSLDYARARQTVARRVVVGLGSGGFDLIARGSATHLVIDVVGYYGGRPPGAAGVD